MNKYFLALSAILFASLFAVFSGSSAFAASSYDSFINVKPAPFEITSYSGLKTHTFDSFSSIYNWLSNDADLSLSQGNCSVPVDITYYSALDAIASDYPYFFTYGFANGERGLYNSIQFFVDITDSVDYDTVWSSSSANITSIDERVFVQFDIILSNNGSLLACGGTPSSSFVFANAASATLGHLSVLPIATNMVITYPPGYDGNVIQPVVPIPLYNNWVPNFVVYDKFDTSKPFRVEISDSNFFTFDKQAFLCSDSLIPALHYEIWDRHNKSLEGDEELLYSGVLSASAPIIHDLPVSSNIKNYRVIGWYECSSGVFPESNFRDFSLNSQGTLNNVSDFDLCMKPEFPFMDINACISNFETIVNMLAFGQLELGNVWIFETGQCRNLTSIGPWLGLSNTYVCPQFPEYIRNVVTPFVTFLLGLLSVQFITRLRSNGI